MVMADSGKRSKIQIEIANNGRRWQTKIEMEILDK